MTNVIAFFIGWICAIIFLIFVVNPDEIWHDRIVKAGHGEYNSTTGEFQFLPSCKDK